MGDYVIRRRLAEALPGQRQWPDGVAANLIFCNISLVSWGLGCALIG
jgi:hypothetical protein